MLQSLPDVAQALRAADVRALSQHGAALLLDSALGLDCSPSTLKVVVERAAPPGVVRHLLRGQPRGRHFQILKQHVLDKKDARGADRFACVPLERLDGALAVAYNASPDKTAPPASSTPAKTAGKRTVDESHETDERAVAEQDVH